MFKEGLVPNLHNLFQKIEEEGTLPICFIRLVLPCYQNQIQSKTEQNNKTIKNYRSISFVNTGTIIFNKILANRIQQYIKKIIHHGQVGFVSGLHA